MNIKYEKGLYVLYDRHGVRQFKSTSYAAVVAHQRKIEQYKSTAKAKKSGK